MSIFSAIRSAAAITAAMAALIAHPNAVLARAPVVLTPSSPWNLDYADDRCRLIRTFGEDDNRTALLMEQVGPSSHVELVVAGKPLRAGGTGRTATLQWGPVFEAFERPFQSGNLGDIKPAMIFGALSPIHGPLQLDTDGDIDEIVLKESRYHPEGTTLAHNSAAIEWIEIGRRGRLVRLGTGPMAKPLAALATCTDDLLKSWGVDPEVVASMVTAPQITNFEDIAKRVQRSYPRKALVRGQMANIQLRLIIDEQGKLADCTQLDLTEAENFDNAACGVFRKFGAFEPARNAAGEPLRSYFMTKIRYVIP